MIEKARQGPFCLYDNVAHNQNLQAFAHYLVHISLYYKHAGK